MIRVVAYLLLTVLIITLLRYIIGAATKVFADFLLPKGTPGPGNAARSASTTTGMGELKRDPVCGTFVAVSTSVKKTVHGEVVHFCSEACRDKYDG
jgi:YHS domain-containing protein